MKLQIISRASDPKFFETNFINSHCRFGVLVDEVDWVKTDINGRTILQWLQDEGIRWEFWCVQNWKFVIFLRSETDAICAYLKFS